MSCRNTRPYLAVRRVIVDADQFGNRYLPRQAHEGPEARAPLGALQRRVSRRRACRRSGTPGCTRTVVDPPKAGRGCSRGPGRSRTSSNLTGTGQAYRPPGHTLKGGQRTKGTGDYEPWIPS